MNRTDATKQNRLKEMLRRMRVPPATQETEDSESSESLEERLARLMEEEGESVT